MPEGARSLPLQGAALDDYLETVIPAASGRALVRAARSSEPIRNVSNSRGNWAGKYPFLKTGLSNPFESWTGERALLILWEYDPDVIEVWAQAVSLPIRYQTTSGRASGMRTVFDFLVLRQDSVSITDFKTSDELKSLVTDSPHRWISLGNGKFDQPPARHSCESLGLKYQLLTENDIPHMLVRNLDFLKPRLEQARPLQNDKVVDLKKILNQEERVTIAHAISILEDASTVYFGHFEGSWILDLRREPVALPDSSFVYKDTDTLYLYSAVEPHRTLPALPCLVNFTDLQPGATIRWDGVTFKVLFRGETDLFLRAADGNLVRLNRKEAAMLLGSGALVPETSTPIANAVGMQILRSTSTGAIDQAVSKLRELERFWNKEQTSTPRRTLFDHQKRYRDAEQDHGNGFIGLIDRDFDKGNRNRKTDAIEYEVRLNAFAWLLRPIPADVAEGYAYYVSECDDKGVTPISQKAFTESWNTLDEHTRKLFREGRRAAYPEKPPRTTAGKHLQQGPPEGDSPFQLVHIDHVQSDTFVRRLNGAQLTGKPWISIAIDAFTRLVLAIWVSLLAPSHASVMMVLRDLVRRHGRLPLFTMTDGGKDFQATRIQTLLASYGVGHGIRPNGEPRFGNAIERLNLDINAYLAKTTLGGNEVLKKPRMSSASHDPRVLAVHTLKSFAARAEELLFEVYPLIFHSGLRQTPFEKRNEASLLQGTEWGKATALDDRLLFQTLVRARKHGGTIRMRDGLRLNHFNYFSPEFSGQTHKTMPEVPLYDPEDPTYVEAKLGTRWVRATMIDSQVRRLPPQSDWNSFLDERIYLSRKSSNSEELHQSNVVKGNFFRADKATETQEVDTQRVPARDLQPVGEESARQSAQPKVEPAPVSWRTENGS